MNTITRTILIIFFFQFSMASFAEEANLKYKAIQSDHIIKILRDLQLKPIFGDKGYLVKALDLNPDIKASPKSLLKVGQTIVLPISKLKKGANFQLSDGGFVERTNPETNLDKVALQKTSPDPKQEPSNSQTAKAPSEQVSSTTDERFSKYTLKVSAGYVLLNTLAKVKNTSYDSNLTSPMGYGASVDFEIPLLARLGLEVGLGYEALKYSKPDGTTFNNESTGMTQIKAGLNYYFTKNLAAYLNYSQNDYIFVTGNSTTTVDLDRGSVNSLALGVEYVFSRAEFWNFGAGGLYMSHFEKSASDLKSGSTILASLFSERNIDEHSAFKITLWGRQRNQDTSLVENKSTAGGASVGYVYKF